MAYACPPVHRHRRAPLAAALLLGLLPLLPPHANAASVPWHSRSFKYVADRKDLKEVLRDLGLDAAELERLAATGAIRLPEFAA